MENATKALMIAAGVLVGLMVVTLMIYGYNQVSSYYNEKEENKKFEQLANFNEQYIPYNRDDVRGSDILSLVNKIIDFNKVKDEEEITISIIIQNNDNGKTFFYKYDEYYATGSREKLIKFGATNKFTEDNINSRLINKANAIESTYTQAKATKLAANMSTLMGDNTRKEPEDLLEELKITYEDEYKIRQIQEDILKYYQYQQFKRAHFNCDKLEYTEQGRVKSFTFIFNGTFE